MENLYIPYIERTEKNSLHAKSAHQVPLKCGLPFSQYTRLWLISCDTADLQARAPILYKVLCAFGDPQNWLDSGLKKGRASHHLGLQKAAQKNKNKCSCIFKSTYSATSQEIKNIINDHWNKVMIIKVILLVTVVLLVLSLRNINLLHTLNLENVSDNS